MSRLEELIKKLCPDGVEFASLGMCSNIVRGTRITKKDLVTNGKYPVISGGVFPMGYINDFNREENTITVAQYGTAGYVDLQMMKFWANDVCYSVFPVNSLRNKFLYYVLKSNQTLLYSMKTDAIPSCLPLDKLKSVSIPLPPLEVQEEIIRILDKFTEFTAELIAELTSELTVRRKQYEYYRDELLTFGDEVEWKTLGECILKSSNIKWRENKEKQFRYIDLSSVNRENNKIYEAKNIDSDNAPSRAQQIVLENDVIFGTTRPMLKRYCLIPEKYNKQICSTGFCVLRANINFVLPKWIFYSISTEDFYAYVERYQKGASYPAITDKEIKSYKIPIPPIEEQQRIVDILDHFNALCNEISKELTTENEARKKQYEYYRDKLLTFKIKK